MIGKYRTMHGTSAVPSPQMSPIRAARQVPQRSKMLIRFTPTHRARKNSPHALRRIMIMKWPEGAVCAQTSGQVCGTLSGDGVPRPLRDGVALI